LDHLELCLATMTAKANTICRAVRVLGSWWQPKTRKPRQDTHRGLSYRAKRRGDWGWRDSDWYVGYASRERQLTFGKLVHAFARRAATRAAWAHDHTTDPSINAAFQTLPGASFTVFGAAPVHNSLLASAAAEIRLKNGFSFAGKFDGEIASRSQTYAGTGTAQYVS
jgi:hypothetical protein